MIEEWKVVEGYSRYKVSSFGRLWDTKRDVEVAQQVSGKPQYKYVNVQRDDGERKFERLHRFVAIAFVEGRSEEFNIVDHIDKDKFNNHHSNLRWVNNSGNQRNLETNIFVGDVFLKDYVLKYEDPENAYGYISRVHRSIGIDDAINQYEEYLIYGQRTLKVEYEGEEYYLIDLCNKYNKSYELVLPRLSQGWPVWNALHNCPEHYHNSFEIPSKSVTGYWIQDQKYLNKEYQYGYKSLVRLLRQGMFYEDILNYDSLDHIRQTVQGVTGTLEELCAHFGKTYSSVQTRLKKGFSLEKALTTPPERIKKVKINGVPNTPKYWYEYFGLDYKKTKKYKDARKLSFEETLEAFGVDVNSLVISYGD